jgi:hypothetical protein
MHYSIRLGRIYSERYRLRIKQVALDKSRPVIDRKAVPFRQIVEHDDFVPSPKQLFNADASYVARTTCYKNFQALKSPFILILDILHQLPEQGVSARSSGA